MQSSLLRPLLRSTPSRLSITVLQCRPYCIGRKAARPACLLFSLAHSVTHRSIILNTTGHRRNNRGYSSQMTDIFYPDPNRPDLFYHFVHPPTPLSPSLPAFALSFLNTTPVSADSETVTGWLPAQTYMTDTPDISGSRRSQEPRETSAGLHDFVPNPKFLKLLHKTIQSSLAAGLDDIWDNGAKQLQQGWMHIHDQRNIPALGRIGDPDDIIASVLIEDSIIVPETYQAMPSYRICTTDGILQLTPGLAKELHRALILKTKEESP